MHLKKKTKEKRSSIKEAKPTIISIKSTHNLITFSLNVYVIVMKPHHLSWLIHLSVCVIILVFPSVPHVCTHIHLLSRWCCDLIVKQRQFNLIDSGALCQPHRLACTQQRQHQCVHLYGHYYQRCISCFARLITARFLAKTGALSTICTTMMMMMIRIVCGYTKRSKQEIVCTAD